MHRNPPPEQSALMDPLISDNASRPWWKSPYGIAISLFGGSAVCLATLFGSSAASAKGPSTHYTDLENLTIATLGLRVDRFGQGIHIHRNSGQHRKITARWVAPASAGHVPRFQPHDSVRLGVHNHKFPSHVEIIRRAPLARRVALLASNSRDSSTLAGLRVAIIGGGPAGLLLAHRLLAAGAAVRLFEGRPDPRQEGTPEGRAYALGLGLRGRTAIRSAGDELWDSVAAQGFGSDRFTLHLPFRSFDLRKPNPAQEPSVLIYQQSLCSSLLTALEERYQSSGRLAIDFNSRVTSVDVIEGQVGGERFDLVAGCDGVQSAVRAAMLDASVGLEVETNPLPGSLKVIRLDSMPAALTNDAVHAYPGVAGLTAFLEPTPQGVCALVSWSANNQSDRVDPAGITDPEEARALFAANFPKLADAFNTTAVGRQFVEQRISTASTVKTSSYHLGRAVLLGDAAHATGGATGQGCNSALQDAVSLADALERYRGEVAPAIAAYSRERVPEGHALLDLALGPRGGASRLRRLLFGIRVVTDSLLSKIGLSDPPLQTLLTTSLKPFAQIRRERTRIFGAFPTDDEFAVLIDRGATAKVV